MPKKPGAATGKVPMKMYWGKADGLDPVFADNLHLQRVNDQCYLTFGQIRPPMVLSGPPKDIEAEIRPIVRIIVSREALQRMADLLSRNLKTDDRE